MKNRIYDVGDRIVLYADFRVRNTDGTYSLADPTTVTVMLRKPDGTENSYTSGVDNPSVGVYTFETPTFLDGEEGTWYYRFKSTGIVGAEEGWFTVRASRFTTP